MGGAVSSGRDNNELIDNLMGGNYIRSRSVERVFRVLDRADYMTPESRDQAYKDLAWRNGALHMSSPCIYSEVMEGLELRPGLSFLNVGSGTGYLSTLAGLILGSGGISHGVEVHSSVVDYANKKLGQFLANSPTLDEFDFCEPKFYIGNGLCLRPQHQPYDRVYCGAGCPAEYEQYFKQLIKVGGVLVMPLNDTLLQVRRVAAQHWVSRNLLTVSFAALRVPSAETRLDYIKLEEQAPPPLQVAARAAVRAGMRRGVLRRHPELREPAPRRAPPAACPRRICIPIEPGGAAEGLNILHDLDAETGANEMNALLSLVIRMDQNRVAGAISFDGVGSSSEARSPSDGSSDEGAPRRGPALRPRLRLARRQLPDTAGSDSAATAGTASDRSEDGGARRSPRGGPDAAGRGPGSQGDGETPKSDKCRRVGPPGRMWAFEFQAAERTPQPTTSSAAAAEGGDASKDDPDASKSKRGSCDCGDGEGAVPSEVELCFRDSKLLQGAAGAAGEACEESSASGGETSDESESEGAGGEESTSKAKRQKLDSGIGENTPSVSSPDKRTSDASDSGTDDAATAPDSAAGGRRRVHKRSRWGLRVSSSSAEEGAAGAGAGAGAGPRRRVPRRGGRGHDARRVRLSIVMKRAVKELPLPYPLKKYVNLGRCFEF